MAYKEERLVTSEKIKRKLDKLGCDGSQFKRKFKKRLKVSKNWIRGYSVLSAWQRAHNVQVVGMSDAIAISSPNDDKLLEVYLVEDCQDHAKSLGVEEVFNSD